MTQENKDLARVLGIVRRARKAVETKPPGDSLGRILDAAIEKAPPGPMHEWLNALRNGEGAEAPPTRPDGELAL